MTETPSEGLQDPSQDPGRSHPEDPSEGASADQVQEPDVPREHSEEPAEGPDDESATS
jgi:hypothetical protein